MQAAWGLREARHQQRQQHRLQQRQQAAAAAAAAPCIVSGRQSQHPTNHPGATSRQPTQVGSPHTPPHRTLLISWRSLSVISVFLGFSSCRQASQGKVRQAHERAGRMVRRAQKRQATCGRRILRACSAPRTLHTPPRCPPPHLPHHAQDVLPPLWPRVGRVQVVQRHILQAGKIGRQGATHCGVGW